MAECGGHYQKKFAGATKEYARTFSVIRGSARSSIEELSFVLAEGTP
jgi:hypothetical protein